MRSVSLQSPAKLNLSLKVVSKRPDGYHELVTLFERIDLCDDIRLTANKDGRIRIFCDHPQVPRGPKNLCYKVARMLKDDFALADGVDIRIKKRIPVAAGLAGGSSNGATVLLGLSKLWKLSLSREELLAYGRKIGSDVPFFLSDASWAVGTDRGDTIRKVSLPAKIWHILVVPRMKMYTPEVFGALSGVGRAPQNLKLTKYSDDVNILIRTLRKNDLFKVGRLLSNDLETAILRVCPSLSILKDKIRGLNAKGVAFSGSGPSVFGLTESRQAAEGLQRILKKRYRQVFVVSTL